MSQPFYTAQIQLGGVVRDSAYVDTYANQVRLTANIADITLIFGVNEDLGPSQAVIKDRVAVRLSMTTVKAVALHMKVAVEAYESVFGSIPTPSSLSEVITNLRSLIESGYRQQQNPQGSSLPPKSD